MKKHEMIRDDKEKQKNHNTNDHDHNQSRAHDVSGALGSVGEGGVDERTTCLSP